MPWPAWLAGLVVAVLGFVPLAVWIPGGESLQWLPSAVTEWVTGGTIAIGGGLVLALLLRRWSPAWRHAIQGHLALDTGSPRRSTVLVVATAGLGVYLAIAIRVFSRRPLIIDEVVQVFQARLFSSGRLWAPTPPHPEFMAVLNLVNDGGKTYSHFPPGGAAALAIGELFGVPWVVAPVFGGLSVFLMGWLLRAVEPKPGVRLLALGLFALAPLTAFMAGTHMNHVPALTCLLVGMAGTLHALQSPRSRPGLAFASGLGFGAAAAIRPLDAFTFALPAGLWYLGRAWRDRSRVRDLLAAGLGIALPMTVFLAVQTATTGSPFRFGYQVLWGANVGLGFHGSPWGESFTPLDGVRLLNLYFLRLQSYLFEIPGPSLLPVLLALLLAQRLSDADRYLLGAAGLLVAAYFAYWHDGFFLGPRFFYPLLPLLVLWTARLPSLLEERFGAGLAYWTVVYGGLVAALVAVTVDIPIRARQYRNAFTTMRWNADSAAAVSGVRNALVLVRESWGAQLIARLWALGVPHGETERLYKRVDACRLEQAIAGYERLAPEARPSGDRIAAELLPLLADSARLVHSPFSADTTELVLPGSLYPQICLDHIAADREGFTLYPPLRLARSGGNVYVRDLQERNYLILAEYPDRPVYLLRPLSAQLAQPPAYLAVSRDSLAHLAFP